MCPDQLENVPQLRDETEAADPPRWSLWVLAARALSCGIPFLQVLQLCGIGERTLYRWQADPRWPDAVAAASAGWIAELTVASRAKLLHEVKGQGTTARWAAERLHPELAPAVSQDDPSRAPLVVVAGSVFGFEHQPPELGRAVELPPPPQLPAAVEGPS